MSSFRQDQTVFDCFDDKQIAQTTPDAWLTRGHPEIYASIFAKTKDNREFDAFSRMVLMAMDEEHSRNSFFIVACKVCRYFTHTSWRKTADACCLKHFWEAWFIEEPTDASDDVVPADASHGVVPSSEKDGRRKGRSKSSSSSNDSASKRKYHEDLHSIRTWRPRALWRQGVSVNVVEGQGTPRPEVIDEVA